MTKISTDDNSDNITQVVLYHLNVTRVANHTLTDLRVTTMSSEETLVEELDLSAASIGLNFSVKL